jgi:hypothetical protein
MIIHPNQQAENAAPATNATEKSSSAATCCQSVFALFATLTVVIGVVVCTVVFAVVLSRQSNDVSTQMLVYTGRRTRDWSTANSYSMHSFEEDQYSRFLVCMKSAGIQIPGNPETMSDYRDQFKKKYDCSSQSDRGWPRDIGFLRCIQRHYSVSFHQSNVFQQCLDLTEGIMVENVQTASSSLLLGSYNYVAMLLTAMGVMAGFMIFTTGGYYTSREIENSADEDNGQTAYMAMRNQPNFQNARNYLRQPVKVKADYNYIASAWYWVPLAMLPNSLAFAWSVIMSMACFFYTYPMKDTWSDTVSTNGGASVFPGTPWTGHVCTGVSLLMGLYFLLCLVEVVSDSYARKRTNVVLENASQESQEAAQASQSQAPGIPGLRPVPPNIPDGYMFPVISKYRNQLPRKSLGARYNPRLHYTDKSGAKDMSLRMTPPLNKVESLCWVFVDGLLFVGMINSQNSPLNENVVAIFFFIILCRAFQFAATYFMDDVLFINNAEVANPLAGLQEGEEANEAQIAEHEQSLARYSLRVHAGIAVVACHLASLWCLITVIYHFTNAISVPYNFPFNINVSGVGTDVHILQICFITTILLLDLIRHAYVFATVLGRIDQHIFWYFMTITNTADWVFRMVFMICMMFPITFYFGDVSKGLNDYVTTVVA